MPWKHKPRAAVCAICGREFTARHNKQKCCSPECSAENWRQYRAKYRAARQKPRKCAWCGREFVPHDSRSRCCSPECSRLFTKEYNREYRRNRKTGIGAERRTLREKILDYADPVSENVLFTARKKPRGTSDVRWRMELSRRRLARIYGRDGGGLPDPDTMCAGGC